MDFTIGVESAFSLEHTLQSGQAFRWQNKGEWWYGVVSGAVLKVRQEGESLRCVSGSDLLDSRFVRNYFRLDEEHDKVLASIMKDDTISQAVQRFYGLRLLRQERWECLASFVLATNSNIPRIKKMISATCSRFGDALSFEGVQYHSFPKPETIANVSIAELRQCGLGYRAPFLKHVAVSVDEGRVDFSELALRDYEEARRILLTKLLGEKLLLGVGPKVADCFLLYSCGKDEAFPIDVWVARVLAKSYPSFLGRDLTKKFVADKNAKLGKAAYEKISSAARSYFGGYAGYAQQYLFMTSRTSTSPQ